jgi:putative peptide zinc metalloprotease protein
MGHARRLLAALAVTIACGAYAASPAAAGGPNNVVLATATADGSSMSNSGLQVAPAFSPTVTSSNIADATSHDCTGCHAVAAALQVIFVTHPSTYDPANVASATNSNCTGCVSFAYANQYVVQVAGPVYLSAEAQQKIAAIRQDVAATVASADLNDLAGAQCLQADLDDLAEQFKSVIDNDLQQAGVVARGSVNEHTDIAPAAG